ncbi:uncharacterized protein PAC_00727 [Phialocephala subalpina]|uniref:Uncharacterized protein n=1 Tax=Phialocephala subalpina TaxID=576137 RepID=A0A1L7WDJ1_9HELO|nr:uncharacterized protein PAC_00727 [Phialocephala subalpina]
MFSSSVGLLALLFAYAKAAAVFNCVLTVPPSPLTATGLATPYKVTGCDQTQFAAQGSFVEAAILDPATGALQIYNPLVINAKAAVAGTDFITPVVPTLPANAVVGIWFGTNAATLTLTGATTGCVNGLPNSIFGQFAHCNGPAFFTAAQTAVSAGLLTIPPPGSSTKAATTQTCPTLRDFRIVDMDQSDNVDTTYLLIGGKKLAQNTDANAAASKNNSTVLSNGSDNALVNDFIAPAMGCSGFTAPSITAPGGTSGGLALNELRGQAFPGAAPALVPLNDDFTVINNNGAITQSLTKTNLYRAGVGQPQAADTANASGTTYCQQYAASGIFIALNQQLFTGTTSPAPAVANNLFTFMANRFATSFGPVPSLGCSTIFGVDIANIVKQTLNGNGVVVAATIDTATLQQILNGQIKAGASGVVSSSTAKPTATIKAKGGATAATSAAIVATSKAGKAGAAGATSSAAVAGTSTAKAAKGTASGKAVNASTTRVASVATIASSAAVVQTSTKAAGVKAKGATSASGVASSVAVSSEAAAKSTGKAGNLKGANAAFNSTLKARNIWS